MEVTDWECPGRKDRDCLCSLWSSKAKRAALLAVIPAREGTEYFSFFFSKMLNFPTPQHRLPRAPLARELLILNHPLLRVKGKVPGLPKEKPSSNTTFEKGCLLCKETKPATEKLFPEEQERPESFPPRFQESQPLLLIRHSLHPFLAFSFKSLSEESSNSAAGWSKGGGDRNVSHSGILLEDAACERSLLSAQVPWRAWPGPPSGLVEKQE